MKPFYWVIACTIFACGQKKNQVSLPPPDVTVVPVTIGNLPIYATYIGQAYGLSDVQIRARVQGLVTGMFFEEGAYVKQGQLLYTIDDLPYQAKVAEAEGRLADAETELSRAKSDLARVKPLVETNALSKRDLDAANAAVGAATGRVKAATASLDNAKITLGFCKITAPISGLIGISVVRTGDFVTMMNSQALNTISDLSKIRVRFPISENDYIHYSSKVKEHAARNNGEPVKVSLYLSDGTLFKNFGTFNIANREIDASTGSLIIEVLVDNNGGELRPGQYIKVKFPSELMENVISVPQRAVTQLQNLFQVNVLGDSNKLVARIVKTGPRIGEQWVITEGLNPGDKVLLLGNKMVRPNTIVNPISASQDSTQPLAK
jgi:membrane fusion protein (multidrug efflux system)